MPYTLDAITGGPALVRNGRLDVTEFGNPIPGVTPSP
jgi:hypothetical protein